MSLPGDLVKRLEVALLDAFRDDDALDRLIRRVGLQGWVLSRAALITRVDKLIEVVDAHGRVLDLIDAGIDLVPGNAVLATVRPLIVAQLEQLQSAGPVLALDSVDGANDRAAAGVEPTDGGRSGSGVAARLLRGRAGLDLDRLVLANVEHEERMCDDLAPKPPGWVWRSTVESAEAGKVSVLAIGETIATSAVYAWIAWRYGTLHLAISACVAPFLLLRTSQSVALGFGLFGKFYGHLMRSFECAKGITIIPNGLVLRIKRWIRSPSIPRSVRMFVLFMSISISMSIVTVIILFIYMYVCIVALCIRVVATATTMCMHPLLSLGAVPGNWAVFTACMDSAHPVEVLPGSTHLPRNTQDLLMPLRTLSALFSRAAKIRPGLRGHIFGSFVSIAILPGIAVISLPAVFYRWSLKGTAVIYTPLLWIIHGATSRSFVTT